MRLRNTQYEITQYEITQYEITQYEITHHVSRITFHVKGTRSVTSPNPQPLTPNPRV